MEPSFTVNDPEIVANRDLDMPNLKLSYNGNEISTVYKARVVIWNAGTKEITSEAISKNTGIYVSYSPEVTILDQKIATTSRSSLKIDSSVISKNNESMIQLTIKGDEALESDDGCELEIFYTGNKNANFDVNGRIKGVKDGFKKVEGERAVKRTIGLREWAHLIFASGYTILGILMLRAEIIRYRKGIKNNIVFGCMCFFPLTLLQIYVTMPLFFGLSWVT